MEIMGYFSGPIDPEVYHFLTSEFLAFDGKVIEDHLRRFPRLQGPVQ